MESGRTKLTRYNDHHNGIFHMLMGQAAAFKQVEPVKEEKKKDMFMERLREEAEKKTKEDAVGLAKIRCDSQLHPSTTPINYTHQHSVVFLQKHTD